MRVDILFDRGAENNDFSSGWGVSYLIEGHILFDAGEKFSYLENNARIMGVNLSNIDKVIISHNHWDHTGGLEGLLKKNKKIEVYACPDFSLQFKKDVKTSKQAF